MSDTHGLHRQLTTIPPADILIHTGDFTNRGRRTEFADFNAWLGELRERGLFRVIIVILGNHEWKLFLKPNKSRDSKEVQARANLPIQDLLVEQKQLLSNATHVLEHQAVTVFGLTIFGSTWCPWQAAGNPDRTGAGPLAAAAVTRRRNNGHTTVHRFGEIPEGVDILMTHGPPAGILDRMELTSHSWGSSVSLRRQIESVRPRVHLFGHLHEQRGYWSRVSPMKGPYSGGVEYKFSDGKEKKAPPSTYPCQVICCNAMKNHPNLEERDGYLAGKPRLLVAERMTRGQSQIQTGWSFRVLQ